MPASRPLTDPTDAWADWPPASGPAAVPAREQRRPARSEREPRRPARPDREERRPARASARPARAPGARPAQRSGATAPPTRASGPAARASARTQAPSGERARRLRHLRALRRDLLIDFVAAFVLMVMVLIATAGLGVVLLLEIPLGALVIGSFVFEWRRRRRR
jgi:hypothetical protein